MLWIALAAAAAQLSAPVPVNYKKWFFQDDVLGLPRGTWSIGVRMIVRPDGTFKECQIEKQREPHVAVYTCQLLSRRAKYLAAHWIDGSAAYGIDRLPVVWVIGDDAEHTPLPPDLDVYVNRLPSGVGYSVYVPVVIAVDARGTIERCAADQRDDLLSTTVKGHVSLDPELVVAACQQITATFKAFPLTDDSGKAVRSVQNALVRFKVRH